MSAAASPLAALRLFGFDGSVNVPFTRQYRVRCTGCSAGTIHGTPVHETGCPNARRECRGCSNVIPVSARYCADCS